jgi:hypothetical protein
LILRIGIPEVSGILPQTAEDRDYPALVSAAAMWEGDRFRIPGAYPMRIGGRTLPRSPSRLDGLDVALDSAGFTAMTNPGWGGDYPWTVEQYVELGLSRRWAFWSAMDYCVEPQVAGNRATVEARMLRTAATLRHTLALIDHYRATLPAHGYTPAEAVEATPDPMPILQGWKPGDYLFSVHLIGLTLAHAGRPWPSLVGVGSVCRRDLDGPVGLWAVLAALDRALPPHVGLHLFGVKGDALPALRDCRRVASVDSMAWDLGHRGKVQRARRELVRGGAAMAEANRAIPCTSTGRAEAMQEWCDKQTDAAMVGPRPGQMSLFWRAP